MPITSKNTDYTTNTAFRKSALPSFNAKMRDLNKENNRLKLQLTKNTNQKQKNKKIRSYLITAFHFIMEQLTAFGAAFSAYLSIAIVIPQPAGIILGILGAFINYGINHFLLKNNRENENPQKRNKRNTGSHFDNFLYTIGLGNLVLGLTERGIKNFISVVIMIHHKIPIFGVYIIAALVTFEALYFYSKTVITAIQKRFSKQEQSKRVFTENLKFILRKKLQHKPFLDFQKKLSFPKMNAHLQETNKKEKEASDFKITLNAKNLKEFFKNQYIKDYRKNPYLHHLATFAHRLITERATSPKGFTKGSTSREAYQYFLGKYKLKPSKESLEAWLSQQLKEIHKLLRAYSSLDPKKFNEKHIDLTSFKNRLLFELHHDTKNGTKCKLPVEESIREENDFQNAFLKEMQKMYIHFKHPSTEPELNRFFHHMAENLFLYYQAKEENINVKLLQKPFCTIPPDEYIYKRPRKVEIYNEVVDCFGKHFLNEMHLKKASAKTMGAHSIINTFQTKFKKSLITNEQLRVEQNKNKFSCFLSACIGPILPAVGLAALVPMPFGILVGLAAYLCFVFINYHFIYKQHLDSLSIKIDENLELENPGMAKQYALRGAMLAYAVGDTFGKFSVFQHLATKAIAIPKFGILILASVIAVATLYRAVAFTWKQISTLYKKSHIEKQNPPEKLLSPTTRNHIASKIADQTHSAKTSTAPLSNEKSCPSTTTVRKIQKTLSDPKIKNSPDLHKSRQTPSPKPKTPPIHPSVVMKNPPAKLNTTTGKKPPLSIFTINRRKEQKPKTLPCAKSPGHYPKISSK
jgi:hypothetical protein